MMESLHRTCADLAAELADLTEQRDFIASYIFPIEPHWSGMKNASVEMFEELEVEIAAIEQVITDLDQAFAPPMTSRLEVNGGH